MRERGHFQTQGWWVEGMVLFSQHKGTWVSGSVRDTQTCGTGMLAQVLIIFIKEFLNWGSRKNMSAENKLMHVNLCPVFTELMFLSRGSLKRSLALTSVCRAPFST